MIDGAEYSERKRKNGRKPGRSKLRFHQDVAYCQIYSGSTLVKKINIVYIQWINLEEFMLPNDFFDEGKIMEHD